MTKSQLLCLLLVAAHSPLCLAQQTAAPLGLELGKATCTEASRKLQGARPDGTSAWARGPILQLPAGAGDLQGLKGGLIVCVDKDRVVAIGLDFDQGGNAVVLTANQLDTKYQQVRRNLPLVGNGFAQWKAANGIVEIDAPHLSFDFQLRYWASGARETYSKFLAEQQRQKEAKKRGSL